MNISKVAPSSACTACPVAQVDRLGVKAGEWNYVIALAGNPNTGKSTLFNALTGLRQHTGNWPGKTVTRMEGSFRYRDSTYQIVDLPGTYSLLAASPEEQVARDFLLFGQPDVAVIVIDATRLERNLNLALQALAISGQTVIALNLIDEARRHGISVNHRALTRELGVPVVPLAARNGEGIPDLLEAIHLMASGEMQGRPRPLPLPSGTLGAVLDRITRNLLSLYPDLPNARWVASRLMDADSEVSSLVENGGIRDLVARQQTQARAVS